MMLDQLLQQVFNGVALGSVYALIALGYSMVYGILEMLNFAHGEIFMSGAFLGWIVLSMTLGGTGGWLPPWVGLGLALLLASGGAALLGAAVEVLAYRPLRRASRLSPLLSALGVSIFLQNVVMLATGARVKIYPVERFFPSGLGLILGEVTLPAVKVFVLGVSLILMILLDLLVRKTRLGRAMRATAEDSEAAAYQGISPQRIITLTFLLGSALAGIAGVLVGLYYGQIDFFMGFSAGMKAFTAAVLGGIGNLRGAMLGGLILGLAESLGVAFIEPVYKDVIAFTLLVLALLLRPSGLLGKQVAEKV